MFLLALFGIVFLNLLCVGANFPSLQSYNAHFGAEEKALALLYVGYSLPRALVSPFWGQLSDRIGRKPVMISSSLATIAGSILWIEATNWWMLLGSRLLDGLLSAQAVVAAAMIADFVKPEKRTAAFGVLGAAVSLGLTLGPIWGGVVSLHFSPAAVGYGFLILQGLSLAIILFLMPETLPKSKRSLKPMTFAEGFAPLKMGGARPFFLLTLLASVIVGVLTISVSLRTVKLLDWTELELAYAFGAIGLTGAIVQGGALRGLLKIASEATLVHVGLALLVVGYLIPSLAFNSTAVFLGIIVVTVGGSLALPCIKGLLSGVSEDQMGSIMGYNQSLQNMGRSVGPLIGTLGVMLLPVGEFLLPALLALVPLGLALVFFSRTKTSPAVRS